MNAPQQNVEGVLVDYALGQGPSAPWCRLTVDLGPLRGHIAVSSRQARKFAIDVIAEQGPYLGYQPPNPQMREHVSVLPFGSQTDREPRWKERQKIDQCARELAALIEKYGEDAFGWALNSKVGS